MSSSTDYGSFPSIVRPFLQKLLHNDSPHKQNLMLDPSLQSGGEDLFDAMITNITFYLHEEVLRDLHDLWASLTFWDAKIPEVLSRWSFHSFRSLLKLLECSFASVMRLKFFSCILCFLLGVSIFLQSFAAGLSKLRSHKLCHT